MTGIPGHPSYCFPFLSEVDRKHPESAFGAITNGWLVIAVDHHKTAFAEWAAEQEEFGLLELLD